MEDCIKKLKELREKNPEDFFENIDEYVEKYNCSGLTYREIAEIFGDISHEAIRQIEQRAYKKLRHPKFGAKLKEILEDYLE